MERLSFLTLMILCAFLCARIFESGFVRWATWAASITIMATTAQIAITTLNAPSEPSLELNGATASRLSPRSFYLIFLDGYGSHTSFPGDVQDFEDALIRHGFEIVDGAVANYSFTHASMSNVLSLDHVFQHGEDSVQQMFRALQGEHEIRRLNESSGRRYVHIESGWIGTRCGSTVEICLGGRLFDSYAWEVGQMTALKERVESTFANPFVVGGLNSLDNLAMHSRLFDTGNDFVFAHVLIPHPPHQLNADCSLRVDGERNGPYVQLGDAEVFPSLVAGEYEQQQACLNTRLEDLLDDFPADASVVLTADHGTDLRGQLDRPPSAWSESDIHERFSIFHAARLPEECRLTSARDLVNLVRSEVACVTGTSMGDVEPYFEITPYYLFPHLEERVLTVADLKADSGERVVRPRTGR